MGLVNSKSPLIKNKQKAQLTFPFYVIFKENSDEVQERIENPSKNALNKALRKSKKYIESYANLEHIVPKGILIKVKDVKYNKNKKELVCNIIFNVAKNSTVTENQYKKYIEDQSNGPFEMSWDDAPAHLISPKIKY